MMNKFLLTLVALMCTTMVFAQKVKKITGEDFGAGITSKRYIAYSDMMGELNSTDTLNITVRATVADVCKMKGCWMVLDDDASTGADVMVRFKDYGFFVPKDIDGKEVIVEGKAYSTVVGVDELRHYAEDAGKSKEEIAMITEEETQYAFLATGVRVIAD
jgi:Domain of unknown function (DUF4920)